MTDAAFDRWLETVGASAAVGADLEWFRELHRADGAADDQQMRVAYRARQLELASWAGVLVNRDIEHTTVVWGRLHALTWPADDDEPWVDVGFGHLPLSGASMMTVDPADILRQVADKVQDAVMGQSSVWPECIPHDAGLHAELRDGRAVWWCRRGDHLVAEIGQLG